MADTFVSVSIGDFTQRGAQGKISAGELGPLMFAEVDASGQDIHRTPQWISRAPAEYLQIALIVSGTAKVGQDGRQTVLRPGDALVYQTNRTFDWLFEDQWNARLFMFPTDLLPITSEEQRRLTARRFDGSEALAGVVTRFFTDLVNTSDQLGPSEQAVMATHATDLVVTLMGQGAEPSNRIRGSVQRTVMLRAQDYIEQRLDDPQLSPAEIAATVGVSTRYLHKLFSEAELSVSSYIRDKRLDRVHQALVRGGGAERPIAAMAFAAGFGDLSAFNRGFKARYGRTPREARADSVDLRLGR